MKLKPILFVLSFISIQLSSQIKITEVYYDTPYNEKLKFTKKINGVETGELMDAVKHHRGEFVEIFNYSDKDINLKNWYLKDYQGIFWLPEKIIRSGEFMLMAYSTLPYNTTPFTEYFPTTAGKEKQIILQDKIILRNNKEEISLGYSFNGNYPLVDKSTVKWRFDQPLSTNFIHYVAQTPNSFYTVKSIQYNPDYAGSNPAGNSQDAYNNYTATPNPLDAVYRPVIERYEDIVKNDFLSYYSLLDWGENVRSIINNTCQKTIPVEEQIPNGVYLSNEKCFNYDASGNLTSATDCSPIKTIASNTVYSPDELANIENNITVFPNPTKAEHQYLVNIMWSGSAINKIYNLRIYTSMGGLVYQTTLAQGANSVSFSLQNQLPGTFIANFVLNTGQVVSKNILKW